MKLQISGQSYEHPSRDANYQRSINLFPSPTGEPKSIQQTTIASVQLHTSGLKSIVTLPGNQVRAIMPFDTKLYVVADLTVYLVTLSTDQASASYTSIGTLQPSPNRISWARNPTQIIIVDGTVNGYIITASTDTLTKISDANFVGGTTVAFIDSYFVLNAPGTSQMYSSAINDGTTYNALDVATAEATPDKLGALVVDKREIWAIGNVHTEVWYDAANAVGYPFSIRDGAVIQQGISAPYSAILADNTLLWLDNRRFLVQEQGYSLNIVSTPAVNAKFQSYSTVSDAFAFAFKDRGHFFYQITFPTAQKTWVYDLTTKMWHERAYHDAVTDTDTRHMANCYADFQNLNLVGAYNSGTIYKMSGDYLDDDGQAIYRLRTTSHFVQELKQYSFNSLELHATIGQGPVTGAGSNPQIMMRYSNNAGYTWSDVIPRSIGQIGQYNHWVRWNRLGSGREWVFEFTCADPVPLGLLELFAEVDGDGNA